MFPEADLRYHIQGGIEPQLPSARRTGPLYYKQVWFGKRAPPL